MTLPVVVLDRTGLAARRDEVLAVYADAMQVPPEAARSRRSILAAHLNRTGLRAVAAFDPDTLTPDGLTPGPLMVGFAYGYLGAAGQWWHDQVREAVGESAAVRWLDGSFEVCELHVRPAQQGTGLGRDLLAALLAGTPARTAVLTTPDLETRARGFYRAGGWVDLARDLRFPGDPRSFAVLGLDLPP